MREPVHAIWKTVEKCYGLNTASGGVELVQQFARATNSDFKSVTHLLAETGRHLWLQEQIMGLGKGVAVDHVQTGTAKPKSSALGKRKAAHELVDDMHYNMGHKWCHYCAGEHNGMNNMGPHLMAACPKMKHDLSLGVKRRNIWSLGKQGDCLPKPMSACETVQPRPPPSPSPVSPPAYMETVMTPGNGESHDTEPMGTDESITSFDVPVYAGRVKEVPIGDDLIADMAVGVNKMAVDMEQADAGLG
ncbi:hypothetical protein PC128_g32 [Phytophthora cactorum]|nr:hypothetical protein PC128_g32 [Phytophthora cactorum]